MYDVIYNNSIEQKKNWIQHNTSHKTTTKIQQQKINLPAFFYVFQRNKNKLLVKRKYKTDANCLFV